jgi:flagellar basal body-associated protein FliL
MITFLVISLLVLALVFGVSSISQSYTTAKQAQATIETTRAAEIANISNLVVILLLVLLVIAIIGIALYFILHIKTSSQQRSTQSQVTHSGNANWDQLLTLLLVQILQNQMEQNASQLNIPPTYVEAPTEDNDLWLLP